MIKKMSEIEYRKTRNEMEMDIELLTQSVSDPENIDPIGDKMSLKKAISRLENLNRAWNNPISIKDDFIESGRYYIISHEVNL